MPKQLHLGDFSMVISQSQRLEPQSIAVNATQDANAFHLNRKSVGKWNHNIKSVAQWAVSMVLADSVQSTEKALVYGQSSWTDMCMNCASILLHSCQSLSEFFQRKNTERLLFCTKFWSCPEKCWEHHGLTACSSALPPLRWKLLSMWLKGKEEKEGVEEPDVLVLFCNGFLFWIKHLFSCFFPFRTKGEQGSEGLRMGMTVVKLFRVWN